MARKLLRRKLLIHFAIVTFMALSPNAPAVAQRLDPENDSLLESGRATKITDSTLGSEIKIVSYNIRWRSNDELQQIVRWLKSGATPLPSVIALQEVDRARKRTNRENHARILAESLGMYYAWTAPHPAAKTKKAEEETGVEILSAYPLEQITRLVLTTNGPNGRSRVALGATIKLGNTPVRIYSVHAETRLAMWEKIDQFRVVLNDLAKFPKDMPAMVLGDFNSWELPTISDVRELFTRAGFTTPLPDDEPTYAKKVIGFNMKLKLDWIWVRGMTPKSYGIDAQMKVSDHFPLWSVVSLPWVSSDQSGGDTQPSSGTR